MSNDFIHVHSPGAGADLGLSIILYKLRRPQVPNPSNQTSWFPVSVFLRRFLKFFFVCFFAIYGHVGHLVELSLVLSDKEKFCDIFRTLGRSFGQNSRFSHDIFSIHLNSPSGQNREKLASLGRFGLISVLWPFNTF